MEISEEWETGFYRKGVALSLDSYTAYFIYAAYIDT
jgi:hypothetical protein